MTVTVDRQEITIDDRALLSLIVRAIEAHEPQREGYGPDAPEEVTWEDAEFYQANPQALRATNTGFGANGTGCGLYRRAASGARAGEKGGELRERR